MKGSLPRRLPEALRFRLVNLKMTANNLRFTDAFEEPFLVDCLNDARIHHRGDVVFCNSGRVRLISARIVFMPSTVGYGKSGSAPLR